MVKIQINYEGGLRCNVTHELSGSRFETDAPLDNNGKGARFSPTDLCASALGSCMATIIGMQLERENLDLSGLRIEVIKEMSTDLPRRIVALKSEIWAPISLDEAQRKRLEQAAVNCPVHQSLHPDIDKSIVFHWK